MNSSILLYANPQLGQVYIQQTAPLPAFADSLERYRNRPVSQELTSGQDCDKMDRVPDWPGTGKRR